MLVTLGGIVRVVRLKHPLNAFEPMLPTVLGMARTEIVVEFWNAVGAIAVEPVAMVTLVSLGQLVKANSKLMLVPGTVALERIGHR